MLARVWHSFRRKFNVEQISLPVFFEVADGEVERLWQWSFYPCFFAVVIQMRFAVFIVVSRDVYESSIDTADEHDSEPVQLALLCLEEYAYLDIVCEQDLEVFLRHVY